MFKLFLFVYIHLSFDLGAEYIRLNEQRVKESVAFGELKANLVSLLLKDFLVHLSGIYGYHFRNIRFLNFWR